MVSISKEQLKTRIADFEELYDPNKQYSYDGHIVYHGGKPLLRFKEGVPRHWQIQENVTKMSDFPILSCGNGDRLEDLFEDSVHMVDYFKSKGHSYRKHKHFERLMTAYQTRYDVGIVDVFNNMNKMSNHLYKQPILHNL